ncbi:ABC transporter permease/substrate binding protein [Fructobacillus sp. M1-13]|uniref:ABC transporter permease subunit n=1 Tax=Fructobacillus papyriferae TaxID=2713171 RepID=A0ABS5QPK2_9LACO|nr:ABC transporter permease/substrate binding protein [Fructobacillus papyriferae]MBS9335109.1 ABC transporter permease subunit [Fructobacillus papyriferae]MCD2159405.1 ABC transporter permease/substrate binding protein [Fructobacillus papyriferae]
MLNSLFKIAKLPLSQWVSDGVNWMTENLSGFFNAIQTSGQSMMDATTGFLNAIPVPVFVIALALLAYFTTPKKYGLPTLIVLGLTLVFNQGLWGDMMQTLTLVFTSSLIALVIGIPLGIWSSKSPRAYAVIKPILDFMQTMPAFVYLIPAVAFFGIGMVPGTFASVIFALPPVVNLTYLGLKQVDVGLVEAADSFGSTTWQKLFKLELPSAKPSIIAGSKQTIMLALSMVVTASMIGAPGLGRGVLSAVQHADVGAGFVNGLALVILAIIIDRFVQKLNTNPVTTPKLPKWRKIAAWAMVAIIAIAGIAGSFAAQKEAGKKVDLGYVEWDSEVASTNVLAEAMRQHGYQVNMTPLDNAVNWQSIANKQIDGTVSAWLPNTQKAMYDKYKNQVDILGPNLEDVKLGLVVPDYMDVNSISDLNNQADKQIVGIEAGAGIMSAAQKTIDTYSNLNGWKLTPSSSGAMPAALDKAYKAKQPIVITGWTPHWIFNKYHLKFLDDPKKTMGTSEAIKTMVRKDFKKANPDAYKVMKNFHWSQDEMQSVMLDIQNGKSPKQAADDYIKAHKSQVNSWFK